MKINSQYELKIGKVGLFWRFYFDTILEDLNDDLKELLDILEILSIDTEIIGFWWMLTSNWWISPRQTWQGWGLTCGHYSRNYCCITYFTTRLKLEDQKPVWNKVRNVGTILKLWNLNYIVRPEWWLEVTWGYTGIFENLSKNTLVFITFNFKMKEME